MIPTQYVCTDVVYKVSFKSFCTTIERALVEGCGGEVERLLMEGGGGDGGLGVEREER